MTKGEKLLLSVDTSARQIMGGVFGVLGLVMLLIVFILFVLQDKDSSHFLDDRYVEDWLPYLISGVCGLLFAIIGLAVRLFSKAKTRKIRRLIKNGTRSEMRVVSNYQNFHRLLNNIPQRVVTFETESHEQFTFKFFNESLAQFFTIGTTMAVRHDDKGNAIPDPEFFG